MFAGSGRNSVLVQQETDKLTLGQTFQVYVPHAVWALIDQQGGKWFTNARMAIKVP